MVEEHFSLREMERRKREQSGKISSSPSSADKTQTPFTQPTHFPTSREEALSARHYLDIIWYRKTIIIVVSMLVMLSSLYKSFTTKPFYKASTQILLKESRGGGMLSFAAGLGMGGGSGGTSLETIAVLSTTTPLLEKVVQKMNYGISKDELGDMITVKPDFDTNILNFIITAPEEKMAIETANTFATTFIEYNADIDRREANKAYEILSKQVKKTKLEMIDIEEEIKLFTIKEGILSIRAEIATKIQQMAQMETSIRSLESQIVAKRVEVTQIKKHLKEEKTTLVTETTATKPLQLQLIKLEMELATTRTRRTDEHPEVVAIHKNIKSIEDLIKQKLEEKVKVETVGRNPVRDNLRSQLSTSMTHLESLIAKKSAMEIIKEDMEMTMSELPDKQIRFARLEAQKNSIGTIFVELQRKYQESRLAKDMYLGNLHHLQPAEKADKIEKNKTRSGILGLIVGFTIGIGLAFFLEYVDDSVKSSNQVRDLLGLNLIGIIPFLSDKEKIVDPGKPESIISETFRTIQNNMRYTSYMHNQKIIMLVSTQGNEGTTTLTINIGISAAMQGKETVLVDCDLRRASLSNYFGVKIHGIGSKKGRGSHNARRGQKVFTAGLTDYLVGEATLKDIVRETRTPDLFFIPAGTRVPNTAELLGSNKMTLLLKALEKRFDLVYIDTPAILPLVDTPVIAPLASAIIFLVEYRKVSIEAVKQSLEKLSQSNSNVVGCIMNKMKRENKHYYYYGKEVTDDVYTSESRESWYEKFKEKMNRRSQESV